MMARRGALVAALVVVLLMAVLVAGYRSATSMPMVRRLDVPLRGYPSGAPPMRVILVSDFHVHDLGTPPGRVAKIVSEINGLKPDLVIAAGDFVGGNWMSNSYSPSEAIAPLAALRAKYGAFAVLGNHDFEADPGGVADALKRAGVKVLINQTASVGPLALGGIDGRVLRTGKEWQARRQALYRLLAVTPGAKVIVAHRPDEANWAPPWVPLVLAGHTHCGQIVLPLVGALSSGSDFGRRYLCGPVREGQRLTVVTAGVGTSKFPIRIGAPPDIWVLEIRGMASPM